MKKFFSILFFILSIVIIVLDISFAVYAMIDLQNTLDVLASTPGTSGADYLGVGWLFGIGLFLISVVGLIFSLAGAKITQKHRIKVVLYCMSAFFILLLLLSAIVFYI